MGAGSNRNLRYLVFPLVIFVIFLIVAYTEFEHLPAIKEYLNLPCTLSTSCNCSCANTSMTSPPCPPSQQTIIKSGPVFNQWHADKVWHYPDTFPLCTMDACFDFSRCENMTDLTIYTYDEPFAPGKYLAEIASSSSWYTSDPDKACIFLLGTDLDNPHKPHPSTLPYWNGGLNHVIATFADKWPQRNPPPHSIGNASIISSELHETTYRPGFDIAIPLPGKIHMSHLQGWKPLERKYFLTFKGLRYLGEGEGTFRSHPSLKQMHNGKDVIIGLSCRQGTNDIVRRERPWLGEECDEDEEKTRQYNFKDLMNSTFCLAPAGRSPSSYRLIEVLSAGAIPVLICDNYVKPFDTLIQWHQCLLQFPTSEMHRILRTLRKIPVPELQRRQNYCLFVYREYLKDDATLARSVVRSLKLRFYGMLANLSETLPLNITAELKRRRLQSTKANLFLFHK